MLLWSRLLDGRERKGNHSNPSSLCPWTRAGSGSTWLLPAKDKWETSREGRKWEEQIIYIKKVT